MVTAKYSAFGTLGAAVWRRPKLAVRGGPAHDQAVAATHRPAAGTATRVVVWAGDGTHLHLLPHARAG